MHPELAGRDLYDREAELFGSTEYKRGNKTKGGQGLRVVPKGQWPVWQSDPAGTPVPNGSPHIYMAYGAVSWDGNVKKQVVRTPRLHVKQKAYFALMLKPSAMPADKDEVLHALWLLGAFGGYGSRSRRGLGSLRVICDWSALKLQDPNVDVAGADEVIRDGLKKILGPRAAIHVAGGQPEPEHTAFSAGSKVWLGPVRDSCEEALQDAMSVYSSYHRLLGAERGHKPGAVGPDHRIRAGWLSSPPKSSDVTPLGAAFGLPHNAQFSPIPSGPKVNVGVGAQLGGRRASPVFVKVLGSQKAFRSLIAWLPARFLPSAPEYEVRVSVNGQPGLPIQYGGAKGIVEFFSGGGATGWGGLATQGWKEVVW